MEEIKLSAWKYGDKNHFYGKKHTYDTLKKIQDTKRKNGTLDNGKKRVICLNTMEIFESLSSAKERYSFNGSIMRSCTNETSTSGKDENGVKLLWELYDDSIQLDEYKNRYIERLEKIDSSKYSHSEETRMKISKSNKGKPNGWIGKRHTDETRKNMSKGSCKKVICLNNMTVYDSGVGASLVFNVSASLISRCCKGKILCVKNGGNLLYFQTYDDSLSSEYYKAKMEELQEQYYKSRKKVICTNTGEIFIGLKEASEKYNVNQSHITKVCRGKAKTAGKHQNGERLVWSYYNED